MPVADILERTRHVVANAEAFDPGKSRRRFLIGAPDAASAVLLPPLLAEMRTSAPGIDLGVRNLVGQFELALSELDQRTLDVALLPLANVPARFVARTLYQEDFVIARRAGHPMGKKLTLARYSAVPHLVVSVSGDPHGMVDDYLAERGLKRRVALTVSNFMQALAIVAESDLVAALPRRFVARHAARFKVVCSEPPAPFLSGPIRAIAPQVATTDAGLSWLLGALDRSAKAALK